jgi:hypothetical protein
MQIVLTGNFIECFDALGCFQGYFELELITKFSKFLGHSNACLDYY